MNMVEATVQNRRIEVPATPDWPDGTKVMVDVMPMPAVNRLDDVDFMTEVEQSDDPDAINRWIAELETLPGITMTPEEEAAMLAWRKKEQEFNLEAARREITKGVGNPRPGGRGLGVAEDRATPQAVAASAGQPIMSA